MIIIWLILCITMIIFNIIVCKKIVKAANCKHGMSILVAILCWTILVRIENVIAYMVMSMFA